MWVVENFLEEQRNSELKKFEYEELFGMTET